VCFGICANEHRAAGLPDPLELHEFYASAIRIVQVELKLSVNTKALGIFACGGLPSFVAAVFAKGRRVVQATVVGSRHRSKMYKLFQNSNIRAKVVA
jgi:hypothetical protein